MKSNTAEKVRCGVIGAGWWATYAHIPALLTDPRASLVAIQKRSAADGEKIARDFGIQHACTTIDELLSIDGLSAVVVSSSPNLHYEHAFAALRCGMHVLIEKPMTITAAEARELVALAERNRCQLLISCPWHYTRHAVEARRRIAAGELGEIRMISILMTNPVAHLIRGESNKVTHGQPYLQPHLETYSDPQVAGGGHIYTQVSHLAAYLTFLSGQPPAEVFARFHNDGGRLDIYDILNIKLQGGCLASIASTGAMAPTERNHEVRVFGTKATLFLELWRGEMTLIPIDGTPITFANLPTDEVYPERAPARNLIDAALDPCHNQSPGTLGLAAMEVIEAACLSARSDRNVAVSSLLAAR
jgi:predicted dehydrogenase